MSSLCARATEASPPSAVRAPQPAAARSALTSASTWPSVLPSEAAGAAGAGAGAGAALGAGAGAGAVSGSGSGSGTGSGSGAIGAAVVGAGATGVLGAATAADGSGVSRSEVDDAAAEASPLADENVAADVRPANVSEDSGPPSWPSTTGVVDPLPAITGIASTSEVTTVLRQTPSASRPLRWLEARSAGDRRLGALVTPGRSGGPSGEWRTL